MLVSIVIPAYNEEALIAEHLEAVAAYSREQPWESETIVVDDGSSDGTVRIVEECAERLGGIRLLRMDQNRGKGHAVRQGLLSARGDVRGFTDADASTPISELDRVLPALASGSEVVIGSRAMRDTETELNAHLHRRLIGRTFNGLLRLLVGLEDQDGRPLADTQCGFKWFTQRACEGIFSRATTDGFAFDVEVLLLANRLGHPVREMAVNWTDRGKSSVNLFIDPLKMLFRVAALRFQHRNVKP